MKYKRHTGNREGDTVTEERQTVVEKMVSQIRARSQEGKAIVVLRCSQERDIRRVVEACPFGTTWRQVKNKTKDSPAFQKLESRENIQEVTAYESLKPMDSHFSWKLHGPSKMYGAGQETKLMEALAECTHPDTALQRNLIYIPNLKKLMDNTYRADNIRGQYVQILKQIAWDKMDGKTNALILIGCTDGWLCEELKEVSYILDIPCPETWELIQIITNACRQCDGGHMGLSNDRLHALAEVMRGFREDDVKSVIFSAFRECQDPTSGLAMPLFRAALDSKRQMIAGIQGLHWVDVDITALGGVAALQSWMKEKQLIFAYPWLAKLHKATGIKGVLLAGLPGSGKTTAAKYAAVLLGGKGNPLPLVQLTLSDLKDKMHGQSEANLTLALQAVENVSPAVLILDELDKVGGSASGENAHEVSRALFQKMLEWLQKEKQKPVFVVAACNNIKELDSTLIRKGRLDEIFFLGFPSACEVEEIFQVHLDQRRNMIFPQVGTDRRYVRTNENVELGEACSWEVIRNRIIQSVLHKCARKERFLCGADVAALLEAAFQKLLVDTLQQEQKNPDSIKNLNSATEISFRYTPEAVAEAMLTVVGNTRSYFDNHIHTAAVYWLDMYEQQFLEAGAAPAAAQDPEDDQDLLYAGLAAIPKTGGKGPTVFMAQEKNRMILPADRNSFSMESGQFSVPFLKERGLLSDSEDLDASDYTAWLERQRCAAHKLEQVYDRYDGVFRWYLAREIHGLMHRRKGGFR